MTVSKSSVSGIRWRSVALPVEHGGWGFISEPILLGLLLAPSWGGLALSVTALAVFLLRQPLKLYLKDVSGGRRVPRTAAAWKFVLIYSAVIVTTGITTLLLLPTWDALLPLVLALPFVMIQLAADVRNRSRTLLAELAGAAAMGALVSTIVMMREWSFPSAIALWLALGVKSLSAVLYVRSRLRLERGKPSARSLAVLAHFMGLAVLVLAAAQKLITWTAPVAMVILLVRAVVGLSSLRKNRPPKIIGFQEIGYGLCFVLLVAVGYAIIGW